MGDWGREASIGKGKDGLQGPEGRVGGKGYGFALHRRRETTETRCKHGGQRPKDSKLESGSEERVDILLSFSLS